MHLNELSSIVRIRSESKFLLRIVKVQKISTDIQVPGQEHIFRIWFHVLLSETLKPIAVNATAKKG